MSEERWLYEEFLLKRWGINQYTLAKILEDGLPCYDQNNQMFIWEDGTDKIIAKYKLSDVEKYEEEHPHLFESDNQGLNAKEKRELGQLRREKEKWDASLNVALKIGIFCRDQNKELTRKKVWDKVYEIDKSLPDTTIEKIWTSIPEKYRSKGGRPKKEK